MSVTSQYDAQARELRVSVKGSFDHTAHRELRDAYRNLPDGVHYILDLSQTEHIDSSTLGMLLLLRDHAGGDKSSIRIQGCRPQVKRIFQIAHFDRLFHIN